MQKDGLSPRNAGVTLALLALGVNIVLSLPGGVGQDSWISLLFSYAFMIPVLFIYARLVKLMPGMDIFEIAEAALGKIAGKILGVLFVLLCLLAASVTLRIYADFIHLTLLNKTPLLVSMALILLVCLYIAKSGVETLGKWCLIIFILFIASSVILDLLSIQYFKWENLMPVMNHSSGELAAAAAGFSSISLGNGVIILALIAGFQKGSSPYRLFFIWGGVATLILTLNFIYACGSIGANSLETVYMPAYKFVGQIKTGTLLDRVEPLAAMVFIQIGISKISACYIAANRGTARLFGLNPYKFIVFPIGLIILVISVILFRNMAEMLEFMNGYHMVAIPFQLVFPLILWPAAEIRAFRNRRRFA